MKEKIRVVLVDDHEVVRLGLMALIDDLPWAELAAEAGNAEEAVRAVEQHRPDVVIMDIRLPGANGIEATRLIHERFPEVRVIMLTSYADDDLIFSALQAGASGYVLKQIGSRSLVDALDAVRKGEALLDPTITQRVINRVREQETQRQASAFHGLSGREMEVLAEVAKGRSNAEIADVLGLSEKTVRNHVSAILAKLDLSNRIEAATFAVRHGIEQQLRGGH